MGGIQIHTQTTLYVKDIKMIRISIGLFENNWKNDLKVHKDGKMSENEQENFEKGKW